MLKQYTTTTIIFCYHIIIMYFNLRTRSMFQPTIYIVYMYTRSPEVSLMQKYSNNNSSNRNLHIYSHDGHTDYLLTHYTVKYIAYGSYCLRVKL